MHSIEISNMTLEDAQKISGSLNTSFDDFWDATTLQSEIQNLRSKYIVAKQNLEIVGFAGVWDGVDQMHITNIAVRKDLRKKGIGSTLLKELISMTKNLNKKILTLEVRETNIPAQKLYLKNGFKILGIRKNYYKAKENAIIMTLYL